MGTPFYDAHSIWQHGDKPRFATLDQSQRCDICIVGAGISGLTLAYRLSGLGYSIVIVDRERLGLGESALSSAHLSSLLDARYSNLIHWHGRDGARLAVESHKSAIALIDEIQMNEGFDCDFRRVDGFFFAANEQGQTQVDLELQAAQTLGLIDVEPVDYVPNSNFLSGRALRIPDQAQIDPLKYLNHLALAVQFRGTKIFTQAEAVRMTGGRPCVVETASGYQIECDALVIATNSPSHSQLTLHAKSPAYRTYMIGFFVDEESVHPHLYWDTDNPFHYVRYAIDPCTKNKVLLIGGEDHRTGQGLSADNHFQNLENWAKRHFTRLKEPVYLWSGQTLQSIDGLAFIGPHPSGSDNVFVVTGDSGQGITHAMIAGTILPELIQGHSHPWSTLYDPARLHWRNVGTFIGAAVASAVPYGDWLKEGDVQSVEQIKNGEGATIQNGLSKAAIYRDDHGRLHSCSAACPHLGGIVRWNSFEKTWDCPCHGSRFDRYGQVLNGPAIRALTPITLDPFPPQSTPLLI